MFRLHQRQGRPGHVPVTKVFVPYTGEFLRHQELRHNAILADVMPPSDLGPDPIATIKNGMARRFGGYNDDFAVARYRERDFAIFLPEWVPADVLTRREMLTLGSVWLRCYPWGRHRNAQPHRSSYRAWIRLINLPFESWTIPRVAAIVGGFGRFVKADAATKALTDLRAYRCQIALDSLLDVPQNLSIVLGEEVFSVMVHLESWERIEARGGGGPPPPPPNGPEERDMGDEGSEASHPIGGEGELANEDDGVASGAVEVEEAEAPRQTYPGSQTRPGSHAAAARQVEPTLEGSGRPRAGARRSRRWREADDDGACRKVEGRAVRDGRCYGAMANGGTSTESAGLFASITKGATTKAGDVAEAEAPRLTRLDPHASAARQRVSTTAARRSYRRREDSDGRFSRCDGRRCSARDGRRCFATANDGAAIENSGMLHASPADGAPSKAWGAAITVPGSATLEVFGPPEPILMKMGEKKRGFCCYSKMEGRLWQGGCLNHTRFTKIGDGEIDGSNPSGDRSKPRVDRSACVSFLMDKGCMLVSVSLASRNCANKLVATRRWVYLLAPGPSLDPTNWLGMIGGLDRWRTVSDQETLTEGGAHMRNHVIEEGSSTLFLTSCGDVEGRDLLDCSYDDDGIARNPEGSKVLRGRDPGNANALTVTKRQRTSKRLESGAKTPVLQRAMIRKENLREGGTYSAKYLTQKSRLCGVTLGEADAEIFAEWVSKRA